jgi:hypothetical protein
MLREPGSQEGPIPFAPTTVRRADHAMTVLQYGIAIVAIAVAILLTAFR